MEGVTFYFDFEVALMELLQSCMGAVLTAIASFITLLGEEAVAVGILGFLYWVWNKEAAVFMGTNVLAGTVINPLLKNVALRRRPYFDHTSIRCLKPVHAGDIYDITVQGYSFPSGHSMNAAILYGSMPVAYSRFKGQTKRKTAETATLFLQIISILLPFLVGLSRVMLGVHYPTDVLVGWTGGILVIVIISYLQKKLRSWQLHLLLIVLALPGFFYCKTNDFYTCFGIMSGFFAANEIEQRYIRFRETRKIPAIILRMAVGLTLYFLLNTAFKLPFPEEFLKSATTAQFLFRSVRYFLVSFLMLGIYPAVFARVKGFS